MKMLHCATFMLLVIGGLNWGLIGLFNFNLVASVLGFSPMFEKLIYVLVGVSAVYLAATHMNNCRDCKGCCTK